MNPRTTVIAVSRTLEASCAGAAAARSGGPRVHGDRRSGWGRVAFADPMAQGKSVRIRKPFGITGYLTTRLYDPGSSTWRPSV